MLPPQRALRRRWMKRGHTARNTSSQLVGAPGARTHKSLLPACLQVDSRARSESTLRCSASTCNLAEARRVGSSRRHGQASRPRVDVSRPRAERDARAPHGFFVRRCSPHSRPSASVDASRPSSTIVSLRSILRSFARAPHTIYVYESSDETQPTKIFAVWTHRRACGP